MEGTRRNVVTAVASDFLTMCRNPRVLGVILAPGYEVTFRYFLYKGLYDRIQF